MRGLTLAVALALPGAAFAQGPAPEVSFAPGYAWFVGPGSPGPASGRIRVIEQPGQGRAAMTLNQVDAYKSAYRRYMGRFGMRLPVSEADARARRAAWQEVVAANPTLRVQDLDLRPLHPGGPPLTLGN